MERTTSVQSTPSSISSSRSEKKVDKYKQFNKCLKLLIRSMIADFPMIKDLRIVLTFYKAMKTLNRKSPQQYFQRVLHDSIPQLLSKDFEYFFQKDYEDGFINNIVKVFKEEFLKLPTTKQDDLWQQVFKLYQLSCVCMKKNDSNICLNNITNGLQG